MPVSEISKGVFIVAPRELPKYKDTAAGEYTSVFTKQRGNQWEMAQKQALLNIELGSKRYEEEMKTLRERIKSLDARTAENKSMTVRVAEGRLDAADAAAIAAMRESGERQKTLAKRQEAQVARITVSGGGETVTDTTRTGGDGGTKPAKLTTDVSSGAMTGIANFEAQTRDPSGTGGEVWLDNKLQRLVKETSGSGSMIVTESAEDRVNARGSVVDRLVAGREADLRKQNPQLTEPQARVQAEKYILDKLGAIDPAAKAEAKTYFDKVYDIQLGTPDAGGGTSTSRTVTTRPGSTTTSKFPNLGEVPDAPTVATPTVAPADDVNTLLAKQLEEIEKERGALARPTFGGTDYITDARDIMRGRFGGFSGAADALPYEQRNVAERLIKDPAYGLSAIERYRDYLAQQRANASNTNLSIDGRLQPADASNTNRTIGGRLAPPPATEPPAAASVPTDVAPPAASADIPVTPVSVAPVEPPLPAQSVPEAVAEAPVALRPEAADLMTPVERAEFYDRLRASAEAIQFRKELAAIDTGGSEINPAFRTPLLPPPLPPRQALSTMAAPQSLAAPFDMQFAVPRTPAPPPPPLGAKEEGQLVVASPAMAPSTSGAAPRGPADVSAAVRPAGPLAGKLPFQVKGETERFAKSVEMADDVRVATKAGIQPTAFGIKKGGPPSTVGYFQNRAEVALELKDKRGKLDRIASSGPGKVAKDLWGQNSKLGKPFENTWQEIQMTFAGDQKSLEIAHEVALAYDIIAKEDKAPLKQSPN